MAKSLGIFTCVLWISIVNGQLFSGLDECTSPGHLLNVTTCFVDKFISISPFSHTTRHLMSSGNEHDVKDAVMRENVIKGIGKEFFEKNHALMENIELAVKAVTHHELEAVLVDKLSRSDVRPLLDTFLHDMMAAVGPVALARLQDVVGTVQPGASGSGGDPSSFVDFSTVVCGVLNPIIGSQFCDCMKDFGQEDLEDGVKWLKCFYNCDDLPQIHSCVDEQFRTCDPTGKWSFASSIVNKGFAGFVDLADTCLLNVQIPSEDPLVLKEGDPAKTLTVSSYMSAGAHCVDLSALSGGLLGAARDVLSILRGNPPDCQVTIEVSTSNYIHTISPDVHFKIIGPVQDIIIGKPRCKSRGLLTQAVIGSHEHSRVDGTCKIDLNSTNWHGTHQIPIRASVDYMKDGDQSFNLTVKLRVKRKAIYNFKREILIEDTDDDESSVCSSLNDPHITTFDGFYYNNHYEGYFYLYKNTDPDYPYEVQAVYQRCADGGATCTCAVAVRSGDDVFVVDRCRRAAASCSGEGCRMLKATMYVNGNLTKGTRVYRQQEGARFDVVLPHGLYVRIENSEDMLNVWLTPSNFDKSHTSGLCGTFNNDPADDLMLPNGTLYNGTGTEERGQPKGFSQEWRVPVEDRIFLGAYAEPLPFADSDYCACSHVLITGVQCKCGGMAETCNFFLDGEITSNISMVMRRSQAEMAALHNLEEPLTSLPNVDIDEEYDPPEFDWSNNQKWNQTAAEMFCEELLLKNPENNIIKECVEEEGEDFLRTVMFQCEEDIMITDDTKWQYAALEAAKVKCWTEKVHMRDTLSLGIMDLPDIIPIIQGRRPVNYVNSSCLNECNGKGTCENGACVCGAGWTGPDCQLASGRGPLVVMDASSVCDSRYEDCQWATVYGAHFQDDGTLQCRVEEMQMRSDGTFKKVKNSVMVPAYHVSSSQLACLLPAAASYRVTLFSDSQAVQVQTTSDSTFVFLAADALCYSCDVTAQTCTPRNTNDHCLIDWECLAPGEYKHNDTCLYCNNTLDRADWTWSEDEACQTRKQEEEEAEAAERKNWNTRVGVACGLSAFIVLVTLALFFVSKKNGGQGQEIELTPAPIEEGKKANKDGSADDAHVYDNPGLHTEDESGNSRAASSLSDDVFVAPATPRTVEQLRGSAAGGSRTRYDSEGSQSVKELMRIKALRDEKRERTESVGSMSVASIGIGGGGGGLAGLGRYSTPSEHDHGDVDRRGLGAHGSPMATKRNPYEDIFINTVF